MPIICRKKYYRKTFCNIAIPYHLIVANANNVRFATTPKTRVPHIINTIINIIDVIALTAAADTKSPIQEREFDDSRVEVVS